VDEAKLGIHLPQPIGRGFGEVAEPVLALPEGGFGLFEGGDVRAQADDAAFAGAPLPEVVSQGVV
ncbi:MAG: hypothetical protein QF830_11900, partial [Rhodospirillales bacterium]|nr:hypothetical protein [Rhodospirillales bacterium]